MYIPRVLSQIAQLCQVGWKFKNRKLSTQYVSYLGLGGYDIAFGYLWLNKKVSGLQSALGRPCANRATPCGLVHGLAYPQVRLSCCQFGGLHRNRVNLKCSSYPPQNKGMQVVGQNHQSIPCIPTGTLRSYPTVAMDTPHVDILGPFS